MTVRVGLVLCAAAAALGPAACSRGSEPAPPASSVPIFRPIDPAQVAAAPGTEGATRYWGVLPCADCAGIRTELVLAQDPHTGKPTTYELVETYLGTMSQEEKPVTTRGTWSIETRADGTPVFVLDGGGNLQLARRFERLNEREVRLLDREGRPIQSSLSYVLTRVANAPVTLGGGTASPGPSAPAAVDGASLPMAMVTDLAAGWPVMLRVGQTMSARLAADRAAGARWTLRAGSDGGIVALQGEPAYEPKGSGPGVEVFQLKATRPGQTTLTFDYRQGPSATAAKSVSYPVTVQ